MYPDHKLKNCPEGYKLDIWNPKEEGENFDPFGPFDPPLKYTKTEVPESHPQTRKRIIRIRKNQKQNNKKVSKTNNNHT